jgi:hypothetical protein
MTDREQQWRNRLPRHRAMIERIHDEASDALEEMQDATERILLNAIDRSGLDISECRHCNQLVVCIPDGMSNICEACAEQEAKRGG